MMRILVAVCLFLATAASSQAAHPGCGQPLDDQLRDADIQRWLIASGFVNGEVGRSLYGELHMAVAYFRASTAADPKAPLSDAECDQLEQNYRGLESFAQLSEITFTAPNLKILFPTALISSFVPEDKKSADPWVEADAPDYSFGYDIFRQALYRETPLSLQAGNLTRWHNSALTFDHSTPDGTIWEGIGDWSHGLGKPTIRYYFHNRAFEYQGAVRGLYLKYSIRPPEWFSTPGYLRQALSQISLTDKIREDFSVSDDRDIAWLMFVQSLNNIIVSHFTEKNGWTDITTRDENGNGRCSIKTSDRRIKDHHVRVIFGTTRRLSPEFARYVQRTATLKRIKRFDPGFGRNDGSERLFGNEASGMLHFGCADLIVGEQPKESGAIFALPAAGISVGIGERERLRRTVRLFHAHYIKGVPASVQRYVRLIDEDQGKKVDTALLFIHGYNSSFGWSLERAAELAAKTEYGSKVYMFSWPSNESYFKYFADVETAEGAQSALQGFIRAILQDRNVTKLDIVAHSMGAQQIINALDRLQTTFDQRANGPDDEADKTKGKVRLRLRQVIFAAPDVDAEVFRERVASMAPLAERITVYVSEADLALRASGFLRGGRPRAGVFRPGEKPIAVNPLGNGRVHVIDATHARQTLVRRLVNLDFGHADFIDDADVNRDIGLVLEARYPHWTPAQRGASKQGNVFCEAGTVGTGIYWIMRSKPETGAFDACPAAVAAK